MKHLLLILPILFFYSCATHVGTMTSNATLSNNNFQITGVAIGTSSTSKVLGIGGLKTKALVYEAKKDLYKNFPLKKGQALVNITVDFKRDWFIVYNKTTVYITAEIVDYNITTNEKTTLEYQKNLTINQWKGAINGDSIYFNHTTLGYTKGVINEIGFNYIKVSYYSPAEKKHSFIDKQEDQFITLKLKYNQVFRTQGNFEYRGKTYPTLGLMNLKLEKSDSEYTEVQLIGIGADQLLLRKTDNDKGELFIYEIK